MAFDTLLYLLFSTVKKAEDLKRDAEHRIGTLPKARRNIYQPLKWQQHLNLTADPHLVGFCFSQR